jgi:hypothetical protein
MADTVTAKQIVVDALDQADAQFTKPQGDIMSCLLAGLIAAMPCFLQGFMNCMGGGAAAGDFKPGERTRCSG